MELLTTPPAIYSIDHHDHDSGFELPYRSAGEAGHSINCSIGLRLPRDLASYPACEPAALNCSAGAASHTAAPPTSGAL